MFSFFSKLFSSPSFKVLLLALFFSLIIKKPEEEEENANDLGMPHLGDDEEYLHQRMTLEELNDPSKLAFLSEMKQMRAELADLPNMDDLEQSRSLRFCFKLLLHFLFFSFIIEIQFSFQGWNFSGHCYSVRVAFFPGMFCFVNL